MKYIIVSLALCLPSLLLAQGISFIDNDLEAAFTKAKAENKVLFVDAYTTWCGPCKWLAAEVFTNDTLGDFYNSNFVNLKIDMEKEPGLTFAKKFEVNAYPTLLYINPKGELVNKVVGAYPATSAWMKFATDAVNPFQSLNALQDKAPREIDNSSFILEYTERLQTAGISTEDILNQFYAEHANQLMRYDVWQVTKNNSHNASSTPIEHLVSNYVAYSELYEAEAEEVLMNAFMPEALSIIRQKELDEQALESYKAELYQRNIPEASKIDFITKLVVAERKKDWKTYETVALQGTMEYASSDAMFLNQIAWNFYEQVENKSSLKQAIEWASAAYAIKPSAAVVDTEAHLLFKTGAKESAIEKQKQAIQLAKMNKEDTTSYEEALLKFQQAN